MLFWKSGFVATSTVPVVHWQIHRCYCVGTEKGLEKGHSYLDSAPYVFFFFFPFPYFSPCKEIQYLVWKLHLVTKRMQHMGWGGAYRKSQTILAYPVAALRSTLAVDLLFPDFLVHENNKTDCGFKLLWIVHLFLLNCFPCWWGRVLLPPGCCL